LSGAPTGVEHDPITSVKRGKLAALASRVSSADYATAAVEKLSGDMSWLSARAMAHDRVLTWAHANGAVIPLPMFSLWSTEAAVARKLTTKARQMQKLLTRVTDADEYGLRIYRRDEGI